LAYSSQRPARSRSSPRRRRASAVGGDGLHHLAPGLDGAVDVPELPGRQAADVAQAGDPLFGRAHGGADGEEPQVAQLAVLAPLPEVVFEEREGLPVGGVAREHLAHGVEHRRPVVDLAVEGGEVFEVAHLLGVVALDREGLEERRRVGRAARLAVEVEERARERGVVVDEGLEAGDRVVHLPDRGVHVRERAADHGRVHARRVAGDEGDLADGELLDAVLPAVGLVHHLVGELAARVGVERDLGEGEPVLGAHRDGQGAEELRGAGAVLGLGLRRLRARDERLGEVARHVPVVGRGGVELLQAGDAARGVARLAVEGGGLAQAREPHQGVGHGREEALEEGRGRAVVADLDVDLAGGLERRDLRGVALVRPLVAGDGLVGPADVLRPDLARPVGQVGGGHRVRPSPRDLLGEHGEGLKLPTPRVVVPEIG
jgi:hypothetical protein